MQASDSYHHRKKIIALVGEDRDAFLLCILAEVTHELRSCARLTAIRSIGRRDTQELGVWQDVDDIVPTLSLG